MGFASASCPNILSLQTFVQSLWLVGGNRGSTALDAMPTHAPEACHAKQPPLRFTSLLLEMGQLSSI